MKESRILIEKRLRDNEPEAAIPMPPPLANGQLGEEPESPYLSVLLGIGSMVALFFSSYAGYILFHALVEVSTIAIALSLFILTWHTRRFLPCGTLLMLGIGYGFIAGIDLLHTLAYKGMAIFPGQGANLPTQLWIAARFLQAILLCVAPLFSRRGINGHLLFGISLIVVSATTALVFSGAFPDCFIEGQGLTPFKIIGEYVISALLCLALLLFFAKRTAFGRGIFTLIVISILCTIGSELAFTSYLSVYGPANMAGHFLKLFAYYLIYRAFIVTGFKSPFALIFRDLQQAQENLLHQREFDRCLLESMADGVVACDASGTLTLFNRAAREWHGLDPMRLPPEEWARHYNLFRADGVTPLPTAEIPLSIAFKGGTVKDKEMTIVAGGKAPRFILANGSEITDTAGHKLGAVVVMRDITATNQLERELRLANQELERRVAERTTALGLSEERFRNLFEGVPDALVIADLETGIIQDANPGAERLFGRTREALIGRHQSELHPPALEEKTRESFRQHAALASSGKRSHPFEHLILHSAGGEIPVEIVTQPVTLGGRKMIQGSFRDITGRKQAEEALRRLNRELRAISSCNQALMKAEDEQTLLAEICRIICDEAGYRLAWAGYAEHDREKTIRPVAWAGYDSDYVAGARLSWSEELERGQGPAGLAIRGGKPVHVQDFAQDARMTPWRQAALARGYHSGIALPLSDKNHQVFGVLLIYSTEPYAVTAEEFKLLEELAGDLAFGITVLRTRAELKRTERVTQARFRMLESAYTADISSDDQLRRMLDEIESLTGSHIGFYHFLQEDQETISLQTWSTNTLARMCTANMKEGKGSHYPLAAAGVWVDCVREQRPVIHNDYASLPHRQGLPAGHALLVRELVVPVFRGSRIVAIIGVGNKPEEYDETDVQIASLLGDFSWEIVIRLQAKEALRQSEARLIAAQRIAHLGNWELDLSNNTLLWSEEIYRIFEINPEQFAASYDAFLDAIHPGDREMVDRAYTQSVANHTPYEIVHRLLMKDGRIKYVEECGETLYADDGRPLRSTGTVHDITGRKMAEEAVLALNQQLESRVRERTAELELKNEELERLNQLFVGRELRMIELKEQIRKLEKSGETTHPEKNTA